MTDPKRTAYVASLRSAADLFEFRDDLPLPYQADQMVFYVRLLPEALALHALMVRPVITRESHNAATAFPVRIKGTLAGMRVEVCIHSDVALDTKAPVLPALVPALAALMNPVKLASVPA